MFRFLEHDSEIGVEACNDSITGMLVDSSKALFSIMTDISKVDIVSSFNVSVESYSVEELVVSLLNELIFLMNVNFHFFSKFEYTLYDREVYGVKKFFLEGKVFGEPISEDKHTLHVEVKAVTFSGLKFFVRENDNSSKKEYCIIFVVDI